MTIKRLGLAVFFIILTLSIGLVSVNSPLSVKAQNNALSQAGNGNDGEQETDQSQSSDQVNQIVSGDTSVLSGNNLLCQSTENPEIDVSNTFCNQADLNNPPSDGQELSQIIIHIQRVGFAPHDPPEILGKIYLVDFDTNTEITKTVSRHNYTIPVSFVIPIGDRYSVTFTPDNLRFIWVLSEQGRADCTIQFLRCEGIKTIEPAFLDLYYFT